MKKLFRNCFIIGRRFRLCHVRFGQKAVEVSTFRRLAEAEEGDTLIRRDNAFGTPEQDAFRRDFTVNALFYDIASFSVIDYVDGLADLEARVIRTIGDPGVRLREDPVRMLRAVAIASRLEFTIDRDTLEAIRSLRGEIVKSSPARILEEFYKILRQGAARRTFQSLHDSGLLAYLLPEADLAIAQGGEAFLGSLARLDEYRNAGNTAPEDLINALLLGTMLVPLGAPLRRPMPPRRASRFEVAEGEEGATAEAPARRGRGCRTGGASRSGNRRAGARRSTASLQPALRAPRSRSAAPHPALPAPPARGSPRARRQAPARRPPVFPRRAALDGDPRRARGPGAGRLLEEPGLWATCSLRPRSWRGSRLRLAGEAGSELGPRRRRRRRRRPKPAGTTP